jgi:hypothetical protein
VIVIPVARRAIETYFAPFAVCAAMSLSIRFTVAISASSISTASTKRAGCSSQPPATGRT